MEPGATLEDELTELARHVGELGAGDPIRPTLIDFAELISAKCARIGDLYGELDCNAGDHIRAVMFDIPDPRRDQKDGP